MQWRIPVLGAIALLALSGAGSPPPAPSQSGAPPPNPESAAASLRSATPAPTKATRVHVKKSARTMEIFAGDTLLATYNVAVGRGGSGPKKMEGDNVTPVGHYRVVKRVPSHLRIFMQIDYPNAEDKARFDEAKKKGDLPKNATIGGDIGIHGEPPEAKPFKKAEYLSHGCVVLEDAEIDVVARTVPDGTPVDIED